MGKFLFLCSFLLLSFALPSFVQAQEVQVNGYFLKDSAKLGERVGYVLKARYHSSLDVLFPDSTYNYGTMEFLEKQTFTSSTQDSITLDSAVYFLSNFSLESTRKFSLPVFEVLRYDSISHFPDEVSLDLQLTIDEIPENLSFQENNAYISIPLGFNYPRLFIISLVSIAVLVALYFLFGKKLVNLWLVYKERKKRKRFLQRWKNAKRTLLEQPTLQSADELLGLWKSYMESLTGKPFREWTSTEIAQHLGLPGLLNDFRKIELVIYADRVDEDIPVSCEKLREVSTEIFEDKIKKYNVNE